MPREVWSNREARFTLPQPCKNLRYHNATRYGTSAKPLASAERIVFNIKGNDYRLVVAIDFAKAIIWIKWIGTHKAYDKIDVTKVRHDN